MQIPGDGLSDVEHQPLSPPDEVHLVRSVSIVCHPTRDGVFLVFCLFVRLYLYLLLVWMWSIYPLWRAVHLIVPYVAVYLVCPCEEVSAGATLCHHFEPETSTTVFCWNYCISPLTCSLPIHPPTHSPPPHSQSSSQNTELIMPLLCFERFSSFLCG